MIHPMVPAGTPSSANRSVVIRTLLYCGISLAISDHPGGAFNGTRAASDAGVCHIPGKATEPSSLCLVVSSPLRSDPVWGPQHCDYCAYKQYDCENNQPIM